MPDLPPGYALRVATSVDDRAIADVMVSAFGPDWSVTRVHEALLDADDVKETFVVAARGVPVATASARLMPEVYPGSGYLHWVAVDADHRGKHLGRVVSLAVLRAFRELGCHDAVLETDPPRLPAIRLYLGLGFRPEHVASEHDAVWRGILSDLEMTPS
jgi:mycothiol synthase